MVFNPLFISNVSASNNVDGAKENKFTNSSYLFADIINVSTEKLVSNDVINIELESKNKALFENLEELTSDSKSDEISTNNDYLGDDVSVLEFLDSILTKFEAIKNKFGDVSSKESSGDGVVSLNKEVLNAIIESVNNGEKFSFPIENNGKEIFVEIQKFDETLKNSDTPKIVKLANTEKINSTEIDYNKVIANILTSLKGKLSSNEFNMSEEKISQLTTKIDTKFSKLVSVNDETFTPQKNILSTLISEAQKELNLSAKESDTLKKIIVDEFVKVINAGTSTESTQPGSVVEEKENFLPLIQNKLGLNTGEMKLLKDIELEKLTLPELDFTIKKMLSNPSQNSEVKSLLSKVEVYLKSNNEVVTTEDVSSKISLPKLSEVLNLTPKEKLVVQSLIPKKVSFAELNSELKALENFKNTSPEIKSVINKMDAILTPKDNAVTGVNTEEKLSLLEISQKLKLTVSEAEAVQKESFKKINVTELKAIVKEDISQNPKNAELKTLFSKLEKLEVNTTSFKNVMVNEKIAVVGQKKTNDDSTFVNKVKTGIKNVFANNEVANSNEVEKEKYLVSLKAERSPESITLKDDLFVNKSKPELLNKTVFASKESVDLSKLRILPLNENAPKENQVVNDKDSKLTKVSSNKIGFIERINIKKEKGNSSSNSGNRESSKHEQSATIKLAGNVELNMDSSKFKPFEKMNVKDLEIEKNNVAVKESQAGGNILQKSTSSDLKVEESQLSKFAVAHNQIIKNDLRVSQKNINKRINLKDLNQELTTLVQKGGKKIVQFQLTPENLGKLDIRLEVVNKVISASIKVDNETTQQLVQNSLEGLKATLNQNGVQYNSLNVSLSNSEDKNQRYFKQKRKNNNNAKMNVEGLDETFSHKNLGYNKYDFIA